MQKIERRNFAGALAFSIFSIGWHRRVESSMPIPPVISLDENLKNYTDVVVSGYLNRFVWINSDLYYKLWSRESIIAENELILHAEGGLTDVGESFIEIIDAKIVLINPKHKGSQKIKCKYERIYVQGPSLTSKENQFDYYSKLIKKQNYFFLNFEGHYGANATKFPHPFFRTAGRWNWEDGKPLPMEQWSTVDEVAKRLGYFEAKKENCQ